MLRQLARLTHPIAAAGLQACAVAVYSTHDDELIAAQESGFEGVACVDDAARLLGVLSHVWGQAPSEPVRTWAMGLVEFLLWMQEDDGSWVNFVEDWDGTRNEHGRTSVPGENFWHARAMLGLHAASRAFGDDRAKAAVLRGFERTGRSAVPSDLRALHLQLGLELLADGEVDGLKPRLRRWADEIASRRDGDILMNNPDERGAPHLWAHIQEGVLAKAGTALNDSALIDLAVASANAFLVPTILGGFERATTTSYDIACVVFSMERLAAVTHDERWAEHAAEARAWFEGRNPAGVPMYDRVAGKVFDGIDDKRVNAHSGAETNIEAASALPSDAIASARLL